MGEVIHIDAARRIAQGVTEARELADAFQSADYTADELATIGEEMWLYAASVAGHNHPPSMVTRRAVVIALEERERCPDPFDQLPQAHGPR